MTRRGFFGRLAVLPIVGTLGKKLFAPIPRPGWDGFHMPSILSDPFQAPNRVDFIDFAEWGLLRPPYEGHCMITNIQPPEGW